MAVENDYHLLVFALNDLAATINGVRDEVVRRLLQENRDGLDPNATQWVNYLHRHMELLEGPGLHLHDDAWKVLTSRPGEPVFTDQPPEAPDAPQ